jgi:hypothetical protein
MDYLPSDPYMLLSAANMLLRDGMYDSLDDLCRAFGRSVDDVADAIRSVGYVYDAHQRQFRPTDA